MHALSALFRPAFVDVNGQVLHFPFLFFPLCVSFFSRRMEEDGDETAFHRPHLRPVNGNVELALPEQLLQPGIVDVVSAARCNR